MLIIGDVHQKTKEYAQIISSYKESICVGDFGFKAEHLWHGETFSPLHKVNFGNHDDPNCLDMPHSCGDFGMFGNIFTIRGAESTDKVFRHSGINWWEEEELSYQRAMDAISFYESCKPEIVISHDAPQRIRTNLFGIHESSFTGVLLNNLFEIHQPKLWIFGHHHRSITITLVNTTFVCLDELDFLVI